MLYVIINTKHAKIDTEIWYYYSSESINFASYKYSDIKTQLIQSGAKILTYFEFYKMLIRLDETLTVLEITNNKCTSHAIFERSYLSNRPDITMLPKSTEGN